jgi:hypothetical protein
MRETGPEKPSGPESAEPNGSRASEGSYGDRVAESRQEAPTDRSAEARDPAASDGHADRGTRAPVGSEQTTETEHPTETEPAAEVHSRAETPPTAPAERSYADRLAESRRAADTERRAEPERPAEPVSGGAADAPDRPADVRADQSGEPLGQDSVRAKGLRERLQGAAERIVGRLKENREGVSLSERPEIERELRDGLDRVREGLERWGPEDQAHAEEWFGSSDENVRERLVEVFGKIEANVDQVRIVPFESHVPAYKQETLVAYVYADERLPDGSLQVHVGQIFENAGTPPDTKAGILVHEMSHFYDIAETEDDDDHYGPPGSRQVAKVDPERALRTADNIEYFFEAYTPREQRRAG